MGLRGKKIVLAASNSESSEYEQKAWSQMLLATLPARYTKTFNVNWPRPNEVGPDGQAKYVPHGLRIVESLLLQKFSADDIAVCYPEQLDRFIGDETRVVGIHAHNPLGITFATDVYPYFYGKDVEPINAAEFRKVIRHPALRRHKPHLKLIVGGPGSWQLERKNLLDEWEVDCLVDGEGEDVVLPLFEGAVRGEPLPRKVEGKSPSLDRIPPIHHRSTYGVVEITRGCGRGCQFCSVALRGGKSIPLPQILHNVRAQVAEGTDTILLTTEDLFLYEQGPKFRTNVPALKRLFESVAAVPGVKHINLTHGTMAPFLANPELLDELSELVVGKSSSQHEESTHPDKRYAIMFIGLETVSPRLFNQYMKGKAYPFRPEQWPDVVLKGMELQNKYNWFPICTFILGLPGETEEDTKQSLDLLFALKDSKWVVVPTLFVPLEDTRLGVKESATIYSLTDLQWEFFFTCWRYNLDFWRRERATQWKFNIGIPIYYYLMGQKIFGSKLKYPLFRLAHFPEWFLRRRLYLDFSGRMQPRWQAPDHVPIPEYRLRPMIPEVSGSTREQAQLQVF
ncbi:MAG: B12-binding domain-containing radical SAM protein [Acidobacteria bacterium]|nr:B12-binding domain-containing radical SAM protein [Acidobacteriota bacterium]